MPETNRLLLDSLEECDAFAKRLADALEPPMTVALTGTLGAGKTQLVRFLVRHLQGDPDDVSSPTYVLHKLYRGKWPIHHFDAYRLDTVEEFWDLGIDEIVELPAIVVIEWADRFPECLPSDFLGVHMNALGGEGSQQRSVELQAHGRRSECVRNLLVS